MGFSVFCKFLAAVHILKVNCTKITRNRWEPTYEVFSFKRIFYSTVYTDYPVVEWVLLHVRRALLELLVLLFTLCTSKTWTNRVNISK